MDHAIDSFNLDTNAESAESNALQLPQFDMANSIAVGIQFQDGIIIGVDTRSTCGNSLNRSDSNKVFKLHDNVFCAGVGFMADLSKMTSVVYAQLKVLNLCTNRRLPVHTARHLMKTLQVHYQGKFMASFIIGGIDKTGIQLYNLQRDGSSEKLPFIALGEGKLSALSVLEERWNPELNETEARDIMMDALAAGGKNVSPYAYNVDICIIKQDYSVEHCLETINESPRNDIEVAEDNDELEEVFLGEATVLFVPINATALLKLVSSSACIPPKQIAE